MPGESRRPSPWLSALRHRLLYSSGTTGLPKTIAHGHGGVLANGMVNRVLHNDLHPGDRVRWAVTGAGATADWGHLVRMGTAEICRVDEVLDSLVVKRDALAQPELRDWFVAFARVRQAG